MKIKEEIMKKFTIKINTNKTNSSKKIGIKYDMQKN